MTSVMAKKEAQEFAVVEMAGKQYKVAVGDVITLDKQFPDFKAGDKMSIKDVLLVSTGSDTKVGAPTVSESVVQAIFEEEGQGKKIAVRRFRSKSRYTRRYGHRQPYTKLKIAAIK